MVITKKVFGFTKENQQVSLYRLKNKQGSFVEILDYGCRVFSIHVPDKSGKLRDVCQGYPCIKDYETDDAYMGAAVGRCANVIAGARFSLNGVSYPLDANDGDNHVHGGIGGFSFCLWNAKCEEDLLIFTRQFSDGSDGYPGNLEVSISYQWSDDNQLKISYEAVSDKDTILNVTNHTYFNLDGEDGDTVKNHFLMVNADSVSEINEKLLPTGKVISVADTPFDFRFAKPLHQDVHLQDPQLLYADGYDHNFVLNGEGFRDVAILYSLKSGISMRCSTDQPALQVYTANALTPRKGKYGTVIRPKSSVCLETQHYPDTPNHTHFPSIILRAKDVFKTETTYTFSLVTEN